MSQSTITLIILVVIGVALLFWIGGTYNVLITLRNIVKNAWSQIDVQLKRRYDLIPRLVNSVKGYAAHEAKIFEEVAKARQMAINAGDNVKAKAEAENALSGTLKSLFAVAENYPDLKANQNFLQLQEELTSTENKIAFARQFYNDSVMNFNTKKETFPTNLIACLFGFSNSEFFEVAETEKAAPEVSF